jgi:hypothetical protein
MYNGYRDDFNWNNQNRGREWMLDEDDYIMNYQGKTWNIQGNKIGEFIQRNRNGKNDAVGQWLTNLLKRPQSTYLGQKKEDYIKTAFNLIHRISPIFVEAYQRWIELELSQHIDDRNNYTLYGTSLASIMGASDFDIVRFFISKGNEIGGSIRRSTSQKRYSKQQFRYEKGKNNNNTPVR